MVVAYNKIDNYKAVTGRGSIYNIGAITGIEIHDNEIFGASEGSAIYFNHANNRTVTNANIYNNLIHDNFEGIRTEYDLYIFDNVFIGNEKALLILKKWQTFSDISNATIRNNAFVKNNVNSITTDFDLTFIIDAKYNYFGDLGPIYENQIEGEINTVATNVDTRFYLTT